ncbi:hypothetical protein Tcan_16517 [Toxocara canis]|uniref:Uncharacterized protein n=1 Tax=Toxocara canis TaxID=6265 RepID=A0A0B2VNU0_TOXCA|nr:hypothetical protein Tcan_16517 [Toxocara canis]
MEKLVDEHDGRLVDEHCGRKKEKTKEILDGGTLLTSFHGYDNKIMRASTQR